METLSKTTFWYIPGLNGLPTTSHKLHRVESLALVSLGSDYDYCLQLWSLLRIRPNSRDKRNVNLPLCDYGCYC